MCRIKVSAMGNIDTDLVASKTADKIRKEIQKFSPNAMVSVDFINTVTPEEPPAE